MIAVGRGPGWVFFKIQDRIQGIRVSPEEELAGLDMPEMGVYAYPYYVLVDAASETNGTAPER